MNSKGSGTKWSWPNLRYYPDICMKVLGGRRGGEKKNPNSSSNNNNNNNEDNAAYRQSL
jgi:hypothetical protein